MRIGIATDRGGFSLKEELLGQLRAVGHEASILVAVIMLAVIAEAQQPKKVHRIGYLKKTESGGATGSPKPGASTKASLIAPRQQRFKRRRRSALN